MAEFRDGQQADILSAIRGAGVLLNGTPADTSRFTNAPASVLQTLLSTTSNAISTNTKPRAPRSSTPGAFTAEETAGSTGPRDKLQDFITRAQAGALTDTNEITALESSMYLSGYDVTFDGAIDATEKNHLDVFSREIQNPDTTLSSLLTTNTETAVEADRVAAERLAEQKEREAREAAEQRAREIAEAQAAELAARTQAELTDRLGASLVYAGYLDPAQVNNPDERVFAMKTLMMDNEYIVNQGGNTLTEELNLAFVAGQPGYPATQHGLALVQKLTEGAMVPAELQQHLESGDPALVSLAQNYMNLSGANVPVTGVTDIATVTAANNILRTDAVIPARLFFENGEINNTAVLIASETGQIVTPDESEFASLVEAGILTTDEAEMAKLLPLAADKAPEDLISRERYLADTMIASSKYQSYLDIVNAQNDEATLDVAVAQPVIDTAITNNPLGLVAAGTDGEELTFGTDLSNNAVGQTSDGTAIFEGDDANYAFIEYLKKGTPEGQPQTITMNDALMTHFYATQTADQAYILPAQLAGGGLSTMPTMGYADELERIVRKEFTGSENNETRIAFDLNDPEDIEMMMTALTVHAQAQKNTLDMSLGENIVVAYINDPKFAGDMDSITRVAENAGVRPTTLGTPEVKVANANSDLENPDIESDADVDAFYGDPTITSDELGPVNITIVNDTAPAPAAAQANAAVDLNTSFNTVAPGTPAENAPAPMGGGPLTLPGLIEIDNGMPVRNSFGGSLNPDQNVFKPFGF